MQPSVLTRACNTLPSNMEGSGEWLLSTPLGKRSKYSQLSSSSYCDSQLRNGATLNATLDWYKCNMKCSASEYETCGGSATYELFNNPDLAPAAISTQLPSGWQDAGCRAEGAGGRALAGYATSGKNMTVKTCVETCAGRGYSIGKYTTRSETQRMSHY